MNIHRTRYTTKVMPHAKRVPWGMETLGFLRSPEMLAPAGVRVVCMYAEICEVYDCGFNNTSLIPVSAWERS